MKNVISNASNHDDTGKPEVSAPCRVGRRMGRKEFNSFLYDLYGCTGKNDVDADVVYEGERFMVEVFLTSPVGLMIALHHDFGEFYGYNFNTVDVFRPATDGVQVAENGEAA